jgi:EpsI family protein
MTKDTCVMTNRSAYVNLLVSLLFAAGATQFLTIASERENVPTRTLLAALPETLGVWKQHEAQKLNEAAEHELGADDYVSRTYINERGVIAFVFIAYYASQRQRKTYHSPQNCLPGAGWTLNASRLHSLNTLPNAINEYVIEKDGEQMLAFYWYQGRGRVIASEYWGRWFTLRDAVMRGRTDGALIRIIVPVARGVSDVQAREDGLTFVQLVAPMLSHYIPD